MIDPQNNNTTINSLRTVSQWIVAEIFSDEIPVYSVWHVPNSYTNVSRCTRRWCTCAHKLIDGNRTGRMAGQGNKAEVNSSALTLFTGTTLFGSRPRSLPPLLTPMMNFGQNLAYVRAKPSCWWTWVGRALSLISTVEQLSADIAECRISFMPFLLAVSISPPIKRAHRL